MAPASTAPPRALSAVHRLLSGLILGLLQAPLVLAETGSPSDPRALAADAMQLLHGDCFSCHNAGKRKGGLDLSSREAALKGGDNGVPLVPGDPSRSPLLSVLGPESDPHMPPKKQLGPAQIETVRRWIEAGAPWDEATLARLAGPREVHPGPLPPGHHPVQALALSPNGTRLAIGRGRDLVVHDLAATNQPVLRRWSAHQDIVRSLAWSPDGRRLASGGFREIAVWKTESFEPAWKLDTNLLGRITALRFSPQGGALVAGDGSLAESGWVRVFAADSGQPLAAWQAHTDAIQDLALSPDGGVLATAGADRLVRAWELVSRQEFARLEGHVGIVSGVLFGATANDLVTVGIDKQLKVWDVKSREAVVTIGGGRYAFGAAAGSTHAARVVAVDEDGRLHAYTDFKRHSGEQSSATASHRELGRWPGPLHAVAVSADGASLYAGGEDGIVRSLDKDGKVLATFAPEPEASPSPEAAREPDPVPVPTFTYDILPMLAKAGCSAGSCHAKADGQNGFKLSVFSYDPRADYAEIVTEARARRIFPGAPEESLLLLKATATIQHGGGRRIDPGSDDYRLVARWIRAGMPYQRTNEPALVRVEVQPREGTYERRAGRQLKVLGHYSDGSTRDVTRLAEFSSNEKELVQVDDLGTLRVGDLPGEAVVIARFLGLVDASRVTVPARTTLPAERYAALRSHNFIDDLAWAQFRKLGLFPSDTCSDAEFFRRAHLDTLGILPTPAETRAFLAESDGPASGGPGSDTETRRARVIERLLDRPEFADYWANKWADLLRPNPDRVGVKSVFTLDQWLRDTFRADTPLDRFARELLLAEGSNHRDGPAVVYRDRREPPELTTLFSQVFLGVRLECAKCHHHPNEKWSQDDFYQLAAYFGPVKQKGAGLSPPISAGTETFYFAAGGAVRHPVTEAVLSPRPPDGPDLPPGHAGDPRRALADWLTSRENPFFARAMVNRVWAAFFGRGFVEPVDDFRVSNPASHEPLLNALAADFAAHGFRLKHLVRTILSSRLYQLSSTPNDHNLGDTRNFSRSYRRRLPAEVLLDAVNDLAGIDDEFNGCPPGTRAMQAWSYKVRSQFLDAFGRPNSSSDCPCERDTRTSVVQALHLMNSLPLHNKLAHASGRAKQLADSPRAPAEIVTELYLAALGRFPTASELDTASGAFHAPQATRQTASEDVLWALLNSPEFVFNH